ncbi:MAG: hypothetical protein H6577_17850 [Lewinellaceae bacterium]|nr:hypothetical protein [Saprospiraceae bacterium]MCB9339990.1 hypothetical protein [Lewinellaceae bacterium]
MQKEKPLQVNAAAATGSADISHSTQVCGWEATSSTPFYCSWPSNKAIGLYFTAYYGERITSSLPLNLAIGTDCTLSFDYIVTRDNDPFPFYPPKILVGLTENNNAAFGMPANANIIASVTPFSLDTDGVPNMQCYPENTAFHHFSEPFTYNGGGQLFLNVSGEPGLMQIPNTNIFISQSAPPIQT